METHLMDPDNAGLPMCWHGGYKNIAVMTHTHAVQVTCLECLLENLRRKVKKERG